MSGDESEKIKLLFLAFDDDGNGVLSYKEFLNAVKKFSQHLKKDEAETLVKKVLFSFFWFFIVLFTSRFLSIQFMIAFYFLLRGWYKEEVTTIIILIIIVYVSCYIPLLSLFYLSILFISNRFLLLVMLMVIKRSPTRSLLTGPKRIQMISKKLWAISTFLPSNQKN